MKQDYSFGIIPFIYIEGVPYYLLVKHTPGHWSFPKGHPEVDEDARQTALRELKEETGIDTVRFIDQFSHSITYTFDQVGDMLEKTVTFFLGESNTDTVQIQEGEITEFAWLPYEEALSQISYDEPREALISAQKYLI